MEIPVQVLVLFVVALLLLSLALYQSVKEAKALRKTLAGRVEYAKQPANTPALPDPGPHEHVWAAEPIRAKLGIGVFPCTVPGCTADPLCHAGKR